ncbi:MAG: hypothetical protein QM808_17450 [Steroidobacteraceae bacterium]
MEIFLLLLDDLDDAVATLRALLPQLLNFLLACGLFALSVVAAMSWPILAASAVAVIAVVSVLVAGEPTLRLKPLRFKVDP